MKTLSIVAITAFAFLGLANFASAQNPFQVSSTTFENNDILPIRVIDNNPVLTPQGTFGNECAPGPNFEEGGNQSPALTWTNIPFNTLSFAVIAYDATAQVFHWGMYNIINKTSLPENAGVEESTFGRQVRNYSGKLGYIGPCPPPNDERGDPHNYVFTVYALRRVLELPRNSDGLALQRAVAGRLAEASISGRWSSTPSTP